MEPRGLLQLASDLPTPAGRCVGFAALIIGLFLSCASPATGLAASPSTLPLTQKTTQNSTTSSTRANSELGSSEREQRIKQRLLTVALVVGVLLLLLSFGYGYLRLELTTRGFYSGRLQIAAGFASISVVTAAYFLWHWLTN